MPKPFPRLSRRRAPDRGRHSRGPRSAPVVAAPAGRGPPAGTITFSTGTKAGVYQKYGDLLRKEIRKDMPDLKVKLETSAGSQENVRLVATGQSDFAIAAADAVETYQQNGDPGADQPAAWPASTTTTYSSSSRPTRTSAPWPT